MTARSYWAPATLLLLGSMSLTAVRQQHEPDLRGALGSALPTEVRGATGADASVSENEARLVGFTDYALRVYGEADPADPASSVLASVYVGYYSSQTRGRTIHSPKNCLPGSGWSVIDSRPETIETASGPATVNRYVLQNDDARALVLYWYQGRGRVAHNEYLVKWDLMRDAAIRRRTDEALVRIVVPVTVSEEAAFELASEIAYDVKPAMERVLPI